MGTSSKSIIIGIIDGWVWGVWVYGSRSSPFTCLSLCPLYNIHNTINTVKYAQYNIQTVLPALVCYKRVSLGSGVCCLNIRTFTSSVLYNPYRTQWYQNVLVFLHTACSSYAASVGSDVERQTGCWTKERARLPTPTTTTTISTISTITTTTTTTTGSCFYCRSSSPKTSVYLKFALCNVLLEYCYCLCDDLVSRNGKVHCQL